MATLTLTLTDNDGHELTETVTIPADYRHAIERLGPGDGWKWVGSHFGTRLRTSIDTAAGWLLVQLMRKAEDRSDD